MDNHAKYVYYTGSIEKRSALHGAIAAWGDYEMASRSASSLSCRPCAPDVAAVADLPTFSRLQHLRPIFQSHSPPVRSRFRKAQPALSPFQSTAKAASPALSR